MRTRRLLMLIAAALLAAAPSMALAQDPSPSATPTASPSATPTPTPSESPPPEESTGGCLDFSSQEEAQTFFEAEGGPEQDPHGLDFDGDGTACEGLVGLEVGVLSAAQDIPRDRDCEEFASQSAAQTYFQQNGGSATNNFDELDDNANGVACDEAGITFQGTFQPSGSATPVPTGGTSTTQSTPTPASATATATPRALTATGGPIETFGITGLALTLGGLVLLYVARRRRRPVVERDDYELIAW